MELIKALEQLSLEVRNKNEILNISEATSSCANSQWQSNNTQPITIRNNENQLQDFNNSIETLFTQITDLEFSEPRYKSHSATSMKRNKFARPLMREQNSGGSMETSQEEDSDCSLPQSSTYSGGFERKTAQFNPLVRDLMERDLSAITDTVRKISRILAIGNDIEIMYYKFLYGQHVDKAYTQSLCDAFIGLCADEPHIKVMPTISRYMEYCKQLMNQLGKDSLFCSTVNATANLQQFSSVKEPNVCDNFSQLQVKDYVCDVDDEEGDFNYDELDEFNSKEISSNTWNNNKLYIGNNQVFK